MDWRRYEETITQRLKTEFPHAKITHDQQVAGRYSRVSRQIDILLESNVLGYPIRGIVDCKSYSRKVDVKVIDSFVGFMADADAQVGIIFTNGGYTDAAKNRAKLDPSSIHLEVVAHDELATWKFDRASLIVPTILGALQNPAHGNRASALDEWVEQELPRVQHALWQLPPLQQRIIQCLSQVPFDKDANAIAEATKASLGDLSAALFRLCNMGHVAEDDGQFRLSDPTFVMTSLWTSRKDPERLAAEFVNYLQYLVDAGNYRDGSYMRAHYPSIGASSRPSLPGGMPDRVPNSE